MKKILTALLLTLGFVASLPAQNVYEDDNVSIDKIESGTWIIRYKDAPNYSSMYVIEGAERALLIDTGDKKDYDLPALVRKCTDKPLLLAMTHMHGDHTACIDRFDEIYVSPDENRRQLQDFKGCIIDIDEGYVFNLGGRFVEAVGIKGHTEGGLIFCDYLTGNCFTGDAFGTGQVWLQMSQSPTPISDYASQVNKMLELMASRHITHLYTGHYGQSNSMFGLTYIQEMYALSQMLLDGSVESVHHNRSAETSNTRMATFNAATIVFNPDKVK